MPQFIPLESVRIASPCHADWAMMDGNDRVKFCGSCRKNVYNLSAMTRSQAEALIAQHEGEVCVRYYQRADGTVMTQDCPVGLAMARRVALAPFKYLATVTGFVLAYGACVFGYRASIKHANGTLPVRETRIFKFLPRVTSPTPTPPQIMMMGAVSMSPVATQAPPVAPTPNRAEVMGKPINPDFKSTPKN